MHLGVARGGYKALLDADLFLPQSWSNYRPRCQEAGIPDDVVYQPKWRLGLEQIYRAMGNGIVLDWLTFDKGSAAGWRSWPSWTCWPSCVGWAKSPSRSAV